MLLCLSSCIRTITRAVNLPTAGRPGPNKNHHHHHQLEMPPKKKAVAASPTGDGALSPARTSWIAGKGLWLSLGVPILLAITFQYIVNHKHHQGIMKISPDLQNQQSYQLGGFEVRWDNGSLSVWPHEESNRQHSLW